MTNAESLLVSLSRAGIWLDVAGDRLRLTGNLAALTDDLKESLKDQKSAILKMWSIPHYPNSEGLVKCCYCTHLHGYRCTRGYQPDGIALLRECGGFIRKDQEA